MVSLMWFHYFFCFTNGGAAAIATAPSIGQYIVITHLFCKGTTPPALDDHPEYHEAYNAQYAD